MLVADQGVAAWVAVHAALSPVIGQGGFAALYSRALHMARSDYQWLAAAYDSQATTTGPGAGFTALRAALAAQATPEAVAAHESMMKTIRMLLANLIGESLTARLLQNIHPISSAGPAVQDPSP
ncbi:MAG: hypothetical protein H7255_13220 [Ramlibacter sp.]|nr:hypothetical protein [Ramlibacter sp.]